MGGRRNFLSEKHTLKYLRQGEVINPNLASRDSWSQWEKTDRRSIVDRAEDKINSLIKKNKAQPLKDDQIVELKKVIQAYSK